MQLARPSHQSGETMNELRALNARFIHNFVTNDVPSHDAILHPGFINIWPTGQRWDRVTYLKYWATAFRRSQMRSASRSGGRERVRR